VKATDAILTPLDSKSQLANAWLTVAEVAKRLSIHPISVYRLCSRRKLPHAKAAGVGIRINHRDLEKFMESSMIEPARTRRAKF
jgi:excisionase family DNA binding protein